MTGTVFATCTSATTAAAFGESTSSHCAPSVCIHVPMPEISTPTHNHANTRCRNGAHGEDSKAAGSPAVTGPPGGGTVTSHRLEAWRDEHGRGCPCLHAMSRGSGLGDPGSTP